MHVKTESIASYRGLYANMTPCLLAVSAGALDTALTLTPHSVGGTNCCCAP